MAVLLLEDCHHNRYHHLIKKYQIFLKLSNVFVHDGIWSATDEHIALCILRSGILNRNKRIYLQ